jgi:hypothetical protein
MDVDRFDHLARALHWRQSRRSALRLLAPAALGALATSLGLSEVRANHFECRHVGARCKRAGQCCSSRCLGPTGGKTCRGHDAGICTTQNVCTTGTTVCGTHVPGDPGVKCACFQTTGKAPFCGRFGVCRACTKDRQCEEEFGAGAACVVHACAGCEAIGTGCVVKCADPD